MVKQNYILTEDGKCLKQHIFFGDGATKNEESSWFHVRRVASSSHYHAATDNALGTYKAYGKNDNHFAAGRGTFNV